MEEIITKKTVIETIGKELEIKLNSYGFKFVKSKQHLIRKNKEGFDRILLDTISGYPYNHQELVIQFVVRINKVENIIELFYDGRFRNMEFAKISGTDFTDYEHLKEENDKTFYSDSYLKCELCKASGTSLDKEFVLHNKKDIEKASSFLKDFVELKGLHFFEQNKSIEYLNKKIKNSLIKNVYGADLRTIMNSLVLMKLCGDEDYNVLLPKYIEWLHPAHGFEKDSHDALNEIIQYLEIKY